MPKAGGRRILIVEDQPILGMELEFVLQQAGHAVVGIAVDASQALALALETRPDLAVVDISLRDGPSGIGVAQALSGDLGVSVLFATAEPEQIPPQFVGAYGVMVKPYSAGSIHAAIDYCLAIRDGLDPGPAPRQLHLAPWLATGGGATENGGYH